MTTTEAPINSVNATTAELELTPDFIQRAMRLCRSDRERLAILLLDDGDESEDRTEVADSWKDEIQRRLNSVSDGTAVTLSPEEVDRRVRESLSRTRAGSKQ